MIDILTGTAFGAQRRTHHREDELALEFPSSVSSRSRGLLALKAQNWRASGSPTPPIPYELCDGVRGDSAASFNTGFFCSDINETSFEVEIDSSVGVASGWKSAVYANSVGTWGSGVRRGITVQISANGTSYINSQMVSGNMSVSAFASAGGKGAFRCFFDGTEAVVIFNGANTYRSAKIDYDFTFTSPLYLFRGEYNGVIRSFRAWAGDTPTHDLVPVIAPDGRGAYYDVVSGTLVESASGTPTPWFAT